MIAVRAGEVFWLVAEPVSHPHVIVEARDGEVVACALTSNLHRAKEGNLPKQSVVVVSQRVVVALASLGERIGALESARLAEIRPGLAFQPSFLAR